MVYIACVVSGSTDVQLVREDENAPAHLDACDHVVIGSDIAEVLDVAFEKVDDGIPFDHASDNVMPRNADDDHIERPY